MLSARSRPGSASCFDRASRGLFSRPGAVSFSFLRSRERWCARWDAGGSGGSPGAGGHSWRATPAKAGPESGAAPQAPADPRVESSGWVNVRPFEVDFTLKYAIQGACTLTVHGKIDRATQWDNASNAVLVACYMNIQEERRRALARAVNYVLEHYPGQLSPGLLKELGLSSKRAPEPAKAPAPPLAGEQQMAAAVEQPADSAAEGQQQQEQQLVAAAGAQHQVAGAAASPPPPLVEGQAAEKLLLKLLEKPDFEPDLYWLCELLTPKLMEAIDEEWAEAMARLPMPQPRQAAGSAGVPAAAGAAAAADGSTAAGAAATDTNAAEAADTAAADAAAADVASLPAGDAVASGEPSAAGAQIPEGDAGAQPSAASSSQAAPAAANGSGDAPEEELRAKEVARQWVHSNWNSRLRARWRRMIRMGLVLWARRQGEQAPAPSPDAEGGAPPEGGASQASQGGGQEAGAGPPRASLVPPSEQAETRCAFSVDAISAGGLPMKYSIQIRAKGPGVRDLQEYAEQCYQGVVEVPREEKWTPLAAVAAPEHEIPDELCQWTMGGIPLLCQDTQRFQCSLLPAAAAAAGEEEAEKAGRGPTEARAGARAGAGAASFGGPVLPDLRLLYFTLAALVASAPVEGAGATTWFPVDGRIQLRGGQEGCSLKVYPEGAVLEGKGALQVQPEAVAELSRQQLWALVDCLDAFSKGSPGFADLRAPRPPAKLSHWEELQGAVEGLAARLPIPFADRS